jgi:phosphoribosylaminoimidazole-succinocarboxamide synthase
MYSGATPVKFLICDTKRFYSGASMKKGYKSVTLSLDVYRELERIRRKMSNEKKLYVSMNDVVKRLIKLYSCVASEDDPNA